MFSFFLKWSQSGGEGTQQMLSAVTRRGSGCHGNTEEGTQLKLGLWGIKGRGSDLKDEKRSTFGSTRNICAKVERNENCHSVREPKLEYGIMVRDWHWKVGGGQMPEPLV